jgi:hypothetical protein
MAGGSANLNIGRATANPTALGVILTFGLLLVITYVLTGFPTSTDYDQLLSRGVFPDVLHERATAWEALWGDPYRPLSEMMPDHGYEVTGSVAPRPPSALLLQTPLVLIPRAALMPTVLVAILALLVWIGWLVQAISRVEPWKLLVATPLVLISLPVFSSISYSPLFAVLTVALILISWRYQDRRWAGVLLGVAMGLRLWPGLIVIGFWIAGKRRLALTASISFVVLTVLGLLLPGVDLESSISSFTNVTDDWLNNNTNSSLALVLWPYGIPPVVATALVALIGVIAAFRNRERAVPITIVAALIASPLSWPTYALVVLPVAALCVRRLPRLAAIAISAPLAMWSLVPTKWIGHAHFMALAALFVLVVSRPRLVAAPSVSGASDPSPHVAT